ncbi:SMP-30/gluconolactonase/LRE family protein [Fulvivirga maritima]|uniref:SMP-30/gluconolactonase/LRE family protein n=1 Tax=Fulvivirga maritima TaxID=2904247 RepID=UPI001F460868|nr:SMP-30/gluconolactonase/LRE family protein [Fulvivirga maritima]UII24395.1 SMP-30/gluconolactonase/LRE family protein [Fulvivirga maritima]
MNKILALLFVCAIPGFASAQLIDDNHIIALGAELTLLSSDYSFTEGPAADKDGNVYFTDQPNNQIIKWDAKTNKLSTFLSSSGRSNGMYFNAEGQLIACADMDNELWAIDQEGDHTMIIDNYGDELLNGPNDLWIAPNGNIYFTDPLYKRDYWTRNPEMQQDGKYVYLLTKQGALSRVTSAYEQPNGIVGTPNGKKLYVADIGAGKIFNYKISKTGELTKKKLFTSMGSDGMTLDNQGNLYITGKGVTVFNKKGKKIAYIPVPEKWTANICFGGTNNNTLFIAASESVYTLKMNVKGAQ